VVASSKSPIREWRAGSILLRRSRSWLTPVDPAPGLYHHNGFAPSSIPVKPRAARSSGIGVPDRRKRYHNPGDRCAPRLSDASDRPALKIPARAAPPTRRALLARPIVAETAACRIRLRIGGGRLSIRGDQWSSRMAEESPDSPLHGGRHARRWRSPSAAW